MKLTSRYLEISDTGVYFATQAGHRQSAIELAVAALCDLPNEPDDLLFEIGESMREWTVEANYQGAWMREYHHWETDTKAYFGAMCDRNNAVRPDWRKLNGSHVDKVKSLLAQFGVSASASLSMIDIMRGRLNDTKHEGRYLATEQIYQKLTAAVIDFWDDLGGKEHVVYMRS